MKLRYIHRLALATVLIVGTVSVAGVAVPNGRGKGALHKMGAVQDGLLKKSLRRNGELLDQALYSILSEDWRVSRTAQPASSERVH